MVQRAAELYLNGILRPKRGWAAAEASPQHFPLLSSGCSGRTRAGTHWVGCWGRCAASCAYPRQRSKCSSRWLEHSHAMRCSTSAPSAACLLILEFARRCLLILELTRPNDRDVLALQNTDTLNTVRYTPLRDRLATLLPGWAVEIQAYTMGILGSHDPDRWRADVNRFGLTAVRTRL